MVMHGDVCSNEYAKDLEKILGFYDFSKQCIKCHVMVFEGV